MSVTWCNLMQDGARWCKMVRYGARWCKMVQNNAIMHHVIPCNTMQYHAISCNTTHFFRSHRSSTLDFHFLSYYNYIKAIKLYKGNQTHLLAICILWHTLAYSGILL